LDLTAAVVSWWGCEKGTGGAEKSNAPNSIPLRARARWPFSVAVAVAASAFALQEGFASSEKRERESNGKGRITDRSGGRYMPQGKIMFRSKTTKPGKDNVRLAWFKSTGEW
jgi:hypothetical protein